MPTFSNSEIEEAKRRVREMQSRAEGYVSNTKAHGNGREEAAVPGHTTQEEKEKCEPEEKEEESQTDDSFLLILILIMILSHEGADNKLLLALLYLLL